MDKGKMLTELLRGPMSGVGAAMGMVPPHGEGPGG